MTLSIFFLVLGWTMAIPLFLAAAIHIYWGFGGFWPATTERELVQTVIGTNRETIPSMPLTVLVALGIAGCGVIVLLLSYDSTIPFLRQIGLLLALVFSLRALSGWVICLGPMGHKVQQPFRRLNVNYYSPFCLFVGLGFFLLSYL